MDKHTFSLCLTHDFSTHFTPESIRKMNAHQEIKCWICDELSLAVFSSGPYSGPLSSFGLPLLGADTIHLRINPFSSLLEVIQDSEQGVKQRQTQYQAKLLNQVYQQVYAQCDSMLERAKRRAGFMEYIKEVSPQMKKLETLLKQVPKIGKGDDHAMH